MQRDIGFSKELEIHTEVHEEVMSVSRIIVSIADVGNTELITRLQVEVAVFCTAANLEAHVWMTEPTIVE